MQKMIHTTEQGSFVIKTYIASESARKTQFYIAAIEIFIQFEPNTELNIKTVKTENFFDESITEFGNIELKIKKHTADPNNTWLYTFQVTYSDSAINATPKILALCSTNPHKAFSKLPANLVQAITQQFTTIQTNFDSYCQHKLAILTYYYKIHGLCSVFTAANRLEKIFTEALDNFNLQPLEYFLRSFKIISTKLTSSDVYQKDIFSIVSALQLDLTLEQIKDIVDNSEEILQPYLEKVELKIQENQTKLQELYSNKIQPIFTTLKSNIDSFYQTLDTICINKCNLLIAYTYLDKIFSLIVKNTLLANDHFALIELHCRTTTGIPLQELKDLHENIEKVSRLELLNSINLRKILGGEAINRSSQSRLQGNIGLFIFNSYPQQARWGYFHQGIENFIHVHLHNLSLFEKIDKIARFRTNIAKLDYVNPNFHNNAEPIGLDNFGKWRHLTNDYSGDYYGYTNKCIVSKAIIPSIIKTFEATEEKELFQSKDITVVLPHEVNIPSGVSFTKIIEIEFKDQKIDGLTITFSKNEESTIKALFEFLQSTYYAPLLQSISQHQNSSSAQIANVDKNKELTQLGTILYYLITAYLFKRGSGSVMKIFAISHITEITGVELEDITMGENHDIPFDIYAQIVELEQFIKDFVIAINYLTDLKVAAENRSNSSNQSSSYINYGITS